MAELFFEDDRMGMQDPIYNNQLQDQSFSDLSYQDTQGVHPSRSHSGLQSIMPHALRNWRSDMNPQNANWAPAYQPGQAFPHENFEEMQFDETSQQPQKKGFNWSNLTTPVMGIMRAFANKMKRSPEKQAEIDAFGKTGMFGNLQGKMWDDRGTGLGKISLRDPKTGAVLVRDKNVDSWRGSKTIKEMEDKKMAWMRNRIKKGLPMSTTLTEFAKQNNMYSGPKGDQVTTGGGQRDTSGWGRADQGYSTRGGFTGKADPTSGGVRGHHGNWADGGRIGYNRGRVVNPGGYAGDEKGGIFEWLKSIAGPESESNPTAFGTQDSLLNQGSIGELENAIKSYEAFMMMGDLDEEQQADYELKLQQLSALIEGAEQKAHGGRAGFNYGGLARLL